MTRHKLDQIDRKILAELQGDGRITNVELSRRVRISAPPCLRRVRALEEAGFIESYHARLNAKALGLPVTVFALVSLDSQHDHDLKAFEDRCSAWPLVRECYMLNGEVDFILKVVAPDLEVFQQFLTDQLTAAPHVSHVKTSFMIRTSKREPIVPNDFLLKSV